MINNVLSSSGQPLDAGTRSFMEPRFGQDFSGVRVHTDGQAAESARAVNARAYTVGRDVVFGEGEYVSGSSEGRRLMAHELAHVGQKTTTIIHRWTAANHANLTRHVISTKFKDYFSQSATENLAYFAGEMDIRARNFSWYLGSKIPILAQPVKYLLDEKEAPNHGEANLYKYQNRTSINATKTNEYISKALNLANDQGISDQPLLELGYGLHVGQDRGAHYEGLPGEGHSREFDPKDAQKKWNTDDPSQNTQGWERAKEHTETILCSFLSSLNTVAKAGLKALSQSKSTEGGQEIGGGVALAQGKPQFYVGYSSYLLSNKRIFGLWSPVFKIGTGVIAGTKQNISLTGEAGLRLTRITPRIYVDVLGGALVGYGFSDKQIMTGVSSTIQAQYTGKQVDLGIILKNLYDIIGNQNILVVGVSTRF
ncbi:MAG: DUF4157 domain-containing protein [Candidatus Electrothrix communis]|nr:MAG: DUF4157 domain-containing protein [Candidatus Electrothrix communis]